MSLIDFDEKEFINSIVYNNNNFEIESILQEKYENEIKFGSEKEKAIYSNYESTFIINEDFDEYYMVKIPNLKNTIFINNIPSLIDILRCKINDEIDNSCISMINEDNKRVIICGQYTIEETKK